MVAIDELVDIVTDIAGKRLRKRYDSTKPQGVRGRNADLTLMRKVLDWGPTVALEKGLGLTYRWVQNQLRLSGRID
jgi:GDP-D-mannose 3',5'-epimerase